LERVEGWRGEIDRNATRERKIRDTEDAEETFSYGSDRGIVGEHNTDAAVEVIDPGCAQPLESHPDIADQALLKKVPIATFEREFVVVNDGAAHEANRQA
jgi:hypothetical protein